MGRPIHNPPTKELRAEDARDMLDAVMEADADKLTSWELDFIDGIEDVVGAGTPLSDPQTASLRGIYTKVVVLR